MNSLNRYQPREALSWSAVSALTKFLDLTAQRQTFCVDETPQKLMVYTNSGKRPQKQCNAQCSGQIDVTRSDYFPWKTCVPLIFHFSGTSRFWLMIWTWSPNIFRLYPSVTLCLLTSSKACLKHSIISFAHLYATKHVTDQRLYQCFTKLTYVRKITEKRAGRDLKKSFLFLYRPK